MRLIAALLVIGCTVSLSSGQWVETTIPLPDSLPGLSGVRALVYHSPNNLIYVGGVEPYLMAVDVATNAKLNKVIDVGPGPHYYLCSAPAENKVYCANRDSTVSVIDGATNELVRTIPVELNATDLLYNESEGKLYCASTDTLLRVIDCTGDSLVARIPVGPGASDLCYSPQLNRAYCSHSSSDEVTVIDCSADTVAATVWVRGVEPLDICYDSQTNCVYTANTASGTVSVIDCAGDTLVRVVRVGDEPEFIMTGPPGKVYCSNYGDSSVTVISAVVKTLKTVRHPYALSYDQVHNRVYAASEYDDAVTVIDAAGDSVVTTIRTGLAPWGLCHDPTDNNTYVSCAGNGMVYEIGGESNSVEAGVIFGRAGPDRLCYNPVSDRLYCANSQLGMLVVVDGNTHAVRATPAVAGGAIGSLVLNSYRNKAYVTAPGDQKVYVVDGSTDRVTARIPVAGGAEMLCYNAANDRVYVAGRYDSIVSAIDCSGDTVVATMHLAHSGGPLAYNNVSNKVYCLSSLDSALTVIDGSMDTVVAVIGLPGAYNDTVCFIPPHNKLYVTGAYLPGVVVVDGAGDSITGSIPTLCYVSTLSYDVANNRVYGRGTLLLVIDPVTDSQVASVMVVGSATAPLDNGRFGDGNRVYCTEDWNDRVWVISGTADTIVRGIQVGDGPTALAWNPAHAWMYVACGASLVVLRDSASVGVDEGRPEASDYIARPTVVRGVLNLGVDSRRYSAYRAELLDAAGRKVLDLHSGANDVRALAPGVYFVREGGVMREQGGAGVRRVVITK